jgi:hypothetical protein
MNRLLLVTCLVGCTNDFSLKADSTTGTSAPDPTAPDTETIPTTPTTPTTTTTTTTTTDCVVPDPLSEPSRDCAGIDTAALAPCACDGIRALTDGQAFTTIAAAVAASSPGQIIKVCPGTWDESLYLAFDRQLVAVDPTPGATVLEASGRDHAVEVTDGGSIIGLTVTGAVQTAITHQGGELVLACDVVVGNTGTDPLAASPGGVASMYGDLVLTETVFEDNHGLSGGAVVTAGTGSLLVEGCTFDANGSDWAAGAILAGSQGEIEIRASTFTDNEAGVGGAVALTGTNQTVLVVDSAFVDNRASHSGGAVYVHQLSSDTLTVQGSTFSGNVAALLGGGVGIWAFATPLAVTVEDSLFSANLADNGGAISLALVPATTGELTLARTAFADNAATTGGAVLGSAAAAPILVVGSELTVLRNAGGADAGALWLDGEEMECTVCDFGSDADDNTPADAVVSGVVYDTLATDFTL